MFVLVGLGLGGFFAYIVLSSPNPRKVLFYRDSMVMVYFRPGTCIIPYSQIHDVGLVTRLERGPRGGVSEVKKVLITMEFGSEEFAIRNRVGFCGTLERQLERYRNEQTDGAQGRNTI